MVSRLSVLRQRALSVVGLVWDIARSFTQQELQMRAQALAYNTLLSLVPLLAVSFSILKGFGVHHKLEPLILEFLKPLGVEANQIVVLLMSFVENVDVGMLGGVGLLLLFYTAISLVACIESAFNHIWQVEQGRAFWRRVSDYLMIILLGPVVIFAVISVWSSQWTISFLAPAVQHIFGFEKFITLCVLTFSFSLITLLITYTQVKWFAALIGGFFAACAWVLVGYFFTLFVVGSASYSGIYSGFASAILFMLWTYLSWLIILVSNYMAYLVQNRFLITNIAHKEPNSCSEGICLHVYCDTNNVWHVTNDTLCKIK